MVTQSCPNPDTLQAFILGNVPEVQATQIADHLDECTVCDQTASSLEQKVDPFVSRLKQPTGDASVFSEADFRDAVRRIADLGRAPSSLDIDLGELDAQGTPFGQYLLLEKIGQGGMGAVYRALHSRLEKIVALKLLPPASTGDETAVARFDREMKAVGRLNHPNIVQALDAGEAEGTHYLVMEYVAGVDVSQIATAGGKLPIADACEIVRQAAIGLNYAHQQGMVHRDVKPSNLMLAVEKTETDISNSMPEVRVKILDLGLALLSDAHRPGQHDLTGSGQLMGTIDYMAPEQGDDSHHVDLRADIYSLGATLFRLLTGQPVFHGPSYQTQLQKMMALANASAPPVQSRSPEIPDALAAIVDRMISRNPDQRFASAAEVAAALAPWAQGASLARLLDERSGAREWTGGGASPLGASSKASPAVVSITAPERPTVSHAGSSVVSPAATIHRPRTDTNRGWWITLCVLLLGGVLTGGVLLGTFFIFRTPEGTIIVEMDDDYKDEVKLNVTGEDKTVTLSAESGWTMKLAKGEYDVELAESTDRFELDKDEVTVTRGEDTIVRVTFKQPIVDQTPPAQENETDTMEELGEQAIAWIARNNALGEEVTNDARRQITAETEQGKGFVYALSGSLLKDGEPTIVAAYNGKLFTMALTAEQERSMGLAKQPIAVCTKGFAVAGSRTKKPEFELVGIEWDEAKPDDDHQNVTGMAGFKRLRESDHPETHYWLRITLGLYQPVTFYQGLSGDLGSQSGQLQIHVDNPWTEATPGTRVGFVEVGRFDGSEDDFDNFVALSEPIATLVKLHPPK